MSANVNPRSFIQLGIAVLTISDSRTLEDDKSGGLLARRVEDAGHRLQARDIVADEVALIRARVSGWAADPEVDVIISTGGTGLTGRDITPEALAPLFDKVIDGFSAVFHRISFDKIGLATIQSRAIAGIVGGTYVFALPGSPGACKDGWDCIIKDQLDYRTGPCNFVEIMPRLNEHLRRKTS